MKKYIKYIPLLLSAALLAGCLKDSPADTRVGAGFVEVELDLSVEDEGEGGTLLSRAFTWDKEYHVETIDVLVFEYDDNATGKGRFRYATHGYDIKNTEDSSAKKFKVMLATEYVSGGVTTSLIGKQVFLLPLANSREVWDNVKGGVSVNDTYKSVVDRLVFDASASWDTSDGSTQYLPMASIPGINPAITNDLKGSDFGTVRLIRSVAAIDVGFNYVDGTPQGFPGFELEEVILCNVTDKGLISHSSQFNVAFSPTIPAGSGIMERVYTPDQPSREGIFNQIYVPETDAVEFGSPARPFMLIGGRYNGAESWYRIEFPSWGEIMPYKPTEYTTAIHRNYRYVFMIDKIFGRGYDSREEAEAGEGKDSKLWINLTVVPFSHRTVPAEPDGPYTFDISQTAFYFDDTGRYFDSKHNDNLLELSTDYRGGWKVDEVTYEVDPGSQFWLRTDIIKGNPFEQGKLRIFVDYNGSGNGRIGYVHLSAGRWKYKIKVQQGEIVNLSVTPASRTISFWSHRNGATSQNTFAVEGGKDWTYYVWYPSGSDWGLTVHKTGDGLGFYVQCDRNATLGVRRANVTITSGSRSITVPITQDWADCGIGGNVVYASFDGTPVKTHLYGGNPLEAAIRWLEIKSGKPVEDWTDDELEGLEKLKKAFPNKEYYACWMLENSKYGDWDTWYYGGSDGVGDAEKIGPYYSYANAPSACPAGWKLPGYDEIICMVNMMVVSELDSYFREDERAALNALISEPNTLTGGYYGTYYEANYGSSANWREWGTTGIFYTDWDGKFPMDSEGELSNRPTIVLTIGIDSSTQVGYAVSSIDGISSDFRLPVRCVRDKTYSYE